MEIGLLLAYYFTVQIYTKSQLKYSVIQEVFPAGGRLERPNLDGLTRCSMCGRYRCHPLHAAIKIKKIDARNIKMLSSVTARRGNVCKLILPDIPIKAW
jgi:hypothetical protein